MVEQTNPEAVVAHIAQKLGESEEQPVTTIQRIVDEFGPEFALEMLQKALAIEEQGGLTINDGTRKRTPGGVFFYLVRGRLAKKDIFRIFYSGWNRPPNQQEPPFKWADRLAIIQELSPDKGEARVKITLIGRPGKVVEKRSFIMTMVRDTKIPPLPKGLPDPPKDPSTYMVYINRKQWNRVKEAIQNPEDMLIIEGVAQYDPELEGIAVFAMNTMTKLSQQKKQKPQPEAQQ
jgi:hypothetical protein